MIAPLLLAVDYFNFTYSTNPCHSNVPVPAVMRKGTFSYEDRKMATGFDLFVRRVVRGSLAPGTRQAVVVMTCDFPIGGTAAAYAFDERGAGAVLLGKVAEANWGGDWGRGPDAIVIRFVGRTLHVEGCAVSNCTVKSATVYALRGRRLVTTAKHTMAS
ncbi:MAG TPA: hypothetical protein VK665_15865 [Candidatus Elarobacter sp.]|nr:hypothetical protein [Candidatus Elarobacter sp.]